MYYNQLNALRAFAVFFVILHHWFPDFVLSRHLPLGETGVILFFVLSGFLITEILIKYKIKANENHISKLKAFKVFFIRRTLRIFPIYYLTLVFFLLLFKGKGDLQQNIFYYLGYATNIYFYKIGHWAFGAHLWTLAVEEQFYLVWPFVIFYTPKNRLLHVVVITIFFGIISKYLFPVHPPLTAILTPHCLDSFGMGALFAVIKILHKDFILIFKQYLMKVSITVFVLAICLLAFKIQYSIMTERLILSILSLGIIVKAVFGFKGIMKIILENKLLSYLGTISYGIYLYHNFLPQVVGGFINKVFGSISLYNNIYIFYITNLFFLLLVSICSWHLIEKPINGFKERFTF